jgi:acyl-CoA synthetase (AMP-forming)/AMP-acid ligase II
MKIGEMAATAVLVDKNGGCQLMAVPLFHITALCPVGLFSIPAGSKVVMMRKWDAGEALKVIPREEVTRFTGVPTMMLDLMNHPDFTPAKVASLKGVAAGGAPVPPSQVAEMRKKSKKTESSQGYGLTETMAMGTINKGADYIRNPTSCGKPIPLMVEVAIIDPETKKHVPTGERGEVCIKGAINMKCYNNQPEKTEEAMDENGYFHTGDIGKVDSGGFVYILDRMKDLIIRGGTVLIHYTLYSHTVLIRGGTNIG